MLTYSLVDRGTIRLDGLERNTGDIARFQGHSYTDKLPGYSLLAVPGYALAKVILRLPDQPLRVLCRRARKSVKPRAAIAVRQSRPSPMA